MRAGLLFGLAATIAFIGGMMLSGILPCINLIIAFGSVIALGWGAGYTAAKTTGAASGQGTGRGFAAGAIAGTVVLIGTVLIFLLVQYIPGVQEAVSQGMQEAMQQNPEMEGVDAGTMLGLGLGLVGFMCGIVNFVLMLISGALGGLMWKGAPATANYVPAGGSYTPNMTYSNPGDESGARVYDPNDPNRPQ
jgi:hypothetical protein